MNKVSIFALGEIALVTLIYTDVGPTGAVIHDVFVFMLLGCSVAYAGAIGWWGKKLSGTYEGGILQRGLFLPGYRCSA